MTEITTIKISRKTKERLDSLKEYKRESYEEILQKALEILNLCKFDPGRARARLLSADRSKKLKEREKVITEKKIAFAERKRAFEEKRILERRQQP